MHIYMGGILFATVRDLVATDSSLQIAAVRYVSSALGGSSEYAKATIHLDLGCYCIGHGRSTHENFPHWAPGGSQPRPTAVPIAGGVDGRMGFQTQAAGCLATERQRAAA